MGEAKESKPRNKLFGYLDNTFSEQGLKTDVSITLTDKTVIKVMLAVAGAVALGVAAFYLSRSVFKSQKS